MLDSKYYEDVFHVSPRDARRAAAYALSYLARGKPYEPVACAVDAVLQGGAQWTTRATWKMETGGRKRLGSLASSLLLLMLNCLS